MRLAVIGTGYVGLVAGAGFAEVGNDVVCVDINAERVALLRQGEVPLHEPGLPELVRSNFADRRLSFTTDLSAAVADAEVVFIAVGTPSLADGSADLTQVLSAAAEAGRHMPAGALIVNKSTVPVGTADRVREVVRAARDALPDSQRPFAVVSNPEFLKEGTAVEDFLKPMRVVVGVGRPDRPLTAAEARARDVMRRLYQPVVRTNDRLVLTDTRSAEMTKYAANAYLATRVSFMNDIANLCERVGADVELVRRAMGMDTRIGPKFLFPGIGYGGSCFPKDVRALLHTAQQHGLELPLVAATDRINERQKLVLFDKVLRFFAADPSAEEQPLRGRTVAVWGLSFKPETDDIREAPAIALCERLLQAGAVVRATDPVAIGNAQWHFAEKAESDESTQAIVRRMPGRKGKPDLSVVPMDFYPDPYEAATGADALLLCTEWRQYRQPNFRRLRELMRGVGVFDGRNIWDSEQLRELGFIYHGIGR